MLSRTFCKVAKLFFFKCILGAVYVQKKYIHIHFLNI